MIKSEEFNHILRVRLFLTRTKAICTLNVAIPFNDACNQLIKPSIMESISFLASAGTRQIRYDTTTTAHLTYIDSAHNSAVYTSVIITLVKDGAYVTGALIILGELDADAEPSA